jgi:hypothetical protein
MTGLRAVRGQSPAGQVRVLQKSCITEGSTGYPGGNGNIPFENGMLSEILLQNGYNTLTPAEQTSAAGSYACAPGTTT